MRKQSETEHQIIQTIRNAVIVRRVLLRQNLPERANCILGKQIIIPNNLRSNEDMREDKEYRDLMRNGDETVDVVFGRWLVILSALERIIVEMRGATGNTWKSISLFLDKNGYTARRYSERQLQNIYNSAIDKIKSRFFKEQSDDYI